MKIEKMGKDRVLIEMDLSEMEEYPAWNTTALAHIKVFSGDKWTDCWLSVINKNGRVRFDINHEKGYPSEQKGLAHKEILAKWLSKNPPVID